MGTRCSVGTLAALVVASAVTPLSGQAALDRLVGVGDTGEPIVITAIDGEQLAILGEATGTPMGFEGFEPLRRDLSILATKNPLSSVLDAMIAADPRYEWRELDGVIVVRPVERWRDEQSPLHASISGFKLVNSDSADALNVLMQMVGNQPIASTIDSRRFSVEVADGASFLEAMNAIVRAHGLLTWSIEPLRPPSREAPLGIFLHLGRHGFGSGLHAGAVLHPTITEAQQAISEGSAILDRIIGSGPNTRILRVMSPDATLLTHLAHDVRVPIGFQSLPVDAGRVVLDERFRLNGLTLREALDLLVAADPRYSWREMNGIVVMRPTASWVDTQDSLFRQVASVQLSDVKAGEAIAAVEAALVGEGRSWELGGGQGKFVFVR